jgi:predicted nucleotidyltransferase
LQSKVYEEIEDLTDKMKKVRGVTGIILFGSYSRGDPEDGSDIDLLVIFRDKESMKKHLREIYKITSESGLLLQVTGLTLQELMRSPLLQPVMREGKIYYADEEVTRELTPKHKPYALVTYSTVNLSPKEKVIFSQKLEGRGRGKYRYEGLVQKLEGFKVGRGVLMIPLKNLRTLTHFLEEKRIDYSVRSIWA